WSGPETGHSGDAIAFAEGRVQAVGRRRDVLGAVASPVDEFDCQGRWLVPGFVDAHVHVRASASAVAAVDLAHVTDGEHLLQVVRAAAAAASPGWLSFARLQLDDVPTAAELDAAAPEHLVRIRHRSLHAWLLGGRALVAARLLDSPGWRPDPTGD